MIALLAASLAVAGETRILFTVENWRELAADAHPVAAPLAWLVGADVEGEVLDAIARRARSELASSLVLARVDVAEVELGASTWRTDAGAELPRPGGRYRALVITLPVADVEGAGETLARRWDAAMAGAVRSACAAELAAEGATFASLTLPAEAPPLSSSSGGGR